MDNRNERVEKLQSIKPEQLCEMYRRLFNTTDGQLVLEDMFGKFYKYIPPSNMTEVGQQSVVLHIENMMYSIQPPQTETQHEHE